MLRACVAAGLEGFCLKTKLLGVVTAVTLFATGNSAVRAGSIGIGDFGPTAVLTDLNNLGNVPTLLAAPLTVGIYTFTTDDGLVRYTNFGVNNSNALGDNTDLGFIFIAIAPGANVTKFGFLVGLAGEAQHHKETVFFFDTNNILLGSIGVSLTEDMSSGGRIQPGLLAGHVTDAMLDATAITVDNLRSVLTCNEFRPRSR